MGIVKKLYRKWETATLSSKICELRKTYKIAVEKINEGFCADFATIIWNRCPQVQILSDEDMGRGEYTHTFIFFNGKYYDAERPNGVKKWQNLPIFKRQNYDAKKS